MTMALRHSGLLTVMTYCVMTSFVGAQITFSDATTEDPFTIPTTLQTSSSNATMNLTSAKPLDVARPSPVLDPVLLTNEQLTVVMDVTEMMQYVIVPCGVVVSCLNILVFAQRSMRNSTAKYVIAISAAQVVFLLFEIGIYILVTFVGQPEGAMNSNVSYALFAYSITAQYMWMVCRRGSSAVTCLVSLERLYAIVRPLHIKGFFLSRYPLVATGATFFLCFAMHLYSPGKYLIKQVAVNAIGQPLYTMWPTQFYLNNKDFINGLSLGAKIVFDFTPMILLILLNILTLLFLRRHTVQRRHLKTTSSADSEAEKTRQRQLTVTMLGSTITYIILSLPNSVHAMLIIVYKGYSPLGPTTDKRLFNLFYFVEEVSRVMMYLSCFTDFVCFLLLSTAFRKTFLSLVSPSCLRHFLLRKEPCAETSQQTNSEAVSNTEAASVST